MKKNAGGWRSKPLLKFVPAIFCTAVSLFALGETSMAQSTRDLDADALIKGDGGKVRLLYSEFGTNSYPAFVMRKFGLDKKHGFELQLIGAATTQARATALQAGNAELGTIDWHEISRFRNAGIKVTGIGPFMRWGADYTVVPKGSPIITLGDLKGKRFGIADRLSMNWIGERAVAKVVYKVDLEKEATIQEAAGPLLFALLQQNQLDASEMFNSMTPGLLATGKFTVLAKVSDLVKQLGLPDAPYLMYAANTDYAAAHPGNLKAFMAAYRDAIHILMTDDNVWLERGRDLKWTDDVSALFREEARTDLRAKFEPNTEADIHKVFEGLLVTTGTGDVMGVSRLPDGFMTLDYQ